MMPPRIRWPCLREGPCSGGGRKAPDREALLTILRREASIPRSSRGWPEAMDVPEVRRASRHRRRRRGAQERRARSDQAARGYEALLTAHAVPIFQQLASALGSRVTGSRSHACGSVRLASDSRGEASRARATPPPIRPSSWASRGRGRRMVTSERPVREGAPLATITDDDVLSFLLSEIAPFVER